MDEKKALADAYFAFHRTVYEPKLLDKKTKELIALAVGSALQCSYCIDSHAQKAKAAGATSEEMQEAIYVAAAVRAGATLSYGKKAWEEKKEG